MKKQITIPYFVYAEAPEDWRYGMADVIDGVHYNATVYEHPKKQPIAKVNLTFEAPEQDVVAARIVAELNQKKKELMAEHYNAITEIDRKIQERLAITLEVAA